MRVQFRTPAFALRAAAAPTQRAGLPIGSSSVPRHSLFAPCFSSSTASVAASVVTTTADSAAPSPFRRAPSLRSRAAFRAVSEAVVAVEGGDASMAPLRIALESAQARLVEVTASRTELETKAQGVAQQALEAAQAVRASKDVVFEFVARIQPVKVKKAALAAHISQLQAKVGDGPEDPTSVDSRALGLATAELLVLSHELEVLRTSLDQSYRNAMEVEAAAAKTEAMEAEAMKAAEAAVIEELQAAIVVKETLIALEKSAVDVVLPANVVPVEPVLKSYLSAPAVLTSIDEGPPPQLSASGKTTTQAPMSTPMKLLLFAAAAAWFLNCTAPGQTVIEMVGSTAPGRVVLDCAVQVTDLVLQVFDIVKEQMGHIHIHEAEKKLLEAIVLLLSSCICVPLVVSKIPGGNPVLGYLLGGALVGPYALGLIQDVKSVQHFAELGVVFLLFNIGLELSLERLAGMAKQVFGMGSLQVVCSLMGVLIAAHLLVGLPVPSGVILGGALAMSSTAVGIKVLEDRGETGSRHGRAIFSVLLFQDLAVVVLLMLIPLLAPSPDGSIASGAAIAQALGLAAVKAVVCIVSIIAGGRLIIQPIFHKINSLQNANLFSVLTLLICLGTSLLTSLCGLSLALGAFLAGLLIAETEFAHQVEDDIAPYKGLLLGLFFMSVGMEISVQLFLERWKEVIGGIVLLVGGKIAVMAAIGPMFGLSKLTAIRSGLLLAPGGEFAFVAFGEALSRGVLPPDLTSVLYLVVALTMALIPYLATLGGAIGKALESSSTKAMQPNEQEIKQLKNHVIICGYGRHGKVVAQVLSESYIPFVALDFNTEAVSAGRAMDLPVYFGDAGSASVMQKLGADRATCAIICLDSPGANYRATWAMTKHFPDVKIYARAHDMSHAKILEKAGATVVVPATLEPTLQLAASVLSTMNFSNDDVAQCIDEYRRNHIKVLRQYTLEMGTTLGYGFEQEEGKDEGKKKLRKKKESTMSSVPLSSLG